MLYAPLRAFARGAIPALPARRRSPVDVVPVDYVADSAHELATCGPDGTFHLVAGRKCDDRGEGLRRLKVYFPYFSMRVRFADGRCSPAPPVERYFDRLLDFAKRARWGRRKLRRGDGEVLVPA